MILRTSAKAHFDSKRVRDDTGFWKVVREYLSTGQWITIGEHITDSGTKVTQYFHQDWQCNLSCYYLVYTGLQDVSDNVSVKEAINMIVKENPTCHSVALNAGRPEVFSFDGEGALFWRFEDMHVEEALSFASSITILD